MLLNEALASSPVAIRLLYTRRNIHCSRASSDDGDEAGRRLRPRTHDDVCMYLCKPGEQAGGEGNPMAKRKSGDGRDTAKETNSHF